MLSNWRFKQLFSLWKNFHLLLNLSQYFKIHISIPWKRCYFKYQLFLYCFFIVSLDFSLTVRREYIWSSLMCIGYLSYINQTTKTAKRTNQNQQKTAYQAFIKSARISFRFPLLYWLLKRYFFFRITSSLLRLIVSIIVTQIVTKLFLCNIWSLWTFYNSKFESAVT